jgi:hypothetical protein
MITEPGIYPNVPMHEYLSDQLCDAPSLGGSGAAKIDAKSLAHFRADALKPRETDATRLGTAAHTYILEGADAFMRAYRVKPEGMSFATKDGKAWRDSEFDARSIVDFEDAQTIFAMAKALQRKPKTAALFAGAEREVTLAVKRGPVWLKSRPDALNRKLRVAVNLKTCLDARPDAIAKDLDKYAGGYYTSAALCVDLLKELTGEEWSYIFVFVEKDAPHESRRVKLAPHVLDWGRLRYQRALPMFVASVVSGEWPGYADDTIEAALPAWAERQLQARHEAGEFTPKQQAAE